MKELSNYIDEGFFQNINSGIVVASKQDIRTIKSIIKDINTAPSEVWTWELEEYFNKMPVGTGFKCTYKRKHVLDNTIYIKVAPKKWWWRETRKDGDIIELDKDKTLGQIGAFVFAFRKEENIFYPAWTQDNLNSIETDEKLK